MKKCLDRAYFILAARAHSVAEIKRKLTAKGYGDAEIEDAVTHLLAHGYLDDESYCHSFAEARVERRIIGPIRLRQELIRKGFDNAIIGATVDKLFEDEESELDIAMKAAMKKLRALKPGLELDVIQRKLYEHLARKGFSMEISRRVALDRLEYLSSDAREK